MNEDLQPTDNDLHRYIDGEMDEEGRDSLRARLERDRALAGRVRRYRLVDQAVREAFGGVEPPAGRIPKAPRWRTLSRNTAAAATLLPAAFLAGWLGHSLLSVSSKHDSLAGGIGLPVQGREHLNTLFHIDLNDEAAMKGLLDRTEAILAAYADQGAQVEVVANCRH